MTSFKSQNANKSRETLLTFELSSADLPSIWRFFWKIEIVIRANFKFTFIRNLLGHPVIFWYCSETWCVLICFGGFSVKYEDIWKNLFSFHFKKMNGSKMGNLSWGFGLVMWFPWFLNFTFKSMQQVFTCLTKVTNENCLEMH